MKKIMILGLFAIASFAESITVVPYGAHLEYTNSTKDTGSIKGAYVGYGDLSYLLEVDASSTSVKYVDTTVSDLEQKNYLITYSSYSIEFMKKFGVHYIDTTDVTLGKGIVYIASSEMYFWEGYNKRAIGIDMFISDYKTGKDNTLIQVSPYVNYQSTLLDAISNSATLKVNQIFSTTNYTSYEFEDTLSYGKIATTLKYFTGKMKTGVKDGGSTVFNTEDILLDGYSIKLATNIYKTIGYSLSLNLSYGKNNFKETDATTESSNTVTAASLVYTF